MSRLLTPNKNSGCLKMQQSLTCQKCNKEIENKCLSCLEQELTDWRPSLAIDFSEKASEFKDKIEIEKTCRSCTNTINVCTKCFHTHIFNWVQEKDPLLAEEFVAFFNILE